MFPATVTENSNFGDGGGLHELVIAHGVEASFGASLDEQRVNELLSKFCFVFVQVARKKVAVLVLASPWWIFLVAKGGNNVNCHGGVVRQRQAEIYVYGARRPGAGSVVGANQAGQGL